MKQIDNKNNKNKNNKNNKNNDNGDNHKKHNWGTNVNIMIAISSLLYCQYTLHRMNRTHDGYMKKELERIENNYIETKKNLVRADENYELLKKLMKDRNDISKT